jgi:hypothetical protein
MTHPGEKLNPATNSARPETEKRIRDFPADEHNTEIAFSARSLHSPPTRYSTSPIRSFFTAKAGEKRGGGGGWSSKTKETVVVASGSGGPAPCFCGTSLVHRLGLGEREDLRLCVCVCVCVCVEQILYYAWE